MNTYTFTTTDAQDAALQFVIGKINSGGAAIAPGDYLQARVKDLLDGYTSQYLNAQAEQQKQSWLAQQTAPALSDLETVRQAKLASLNAAYQAQVNAGITPQGTTTVLAAQTSDQAQFTALITLLREVENMQPTDAAKTAFEASMQTITDINGNPLSVPVSTLRAMVVSYGEQISALWGAYAAKRSQVNAATTIDAINAIS